MDMKEVNLLNNIIEDMEVMIIQLNSLPKSRDVSIAVTNVETAQLWAMKFQREIEIND
jgi:hypothetical protein